MIQSNKGQSSIEIIIGILFLIFFLYVFNMLAEDTARTLEINKIKEQEQEIVLSLSDFLYSGGNIFSDSHFGVIDYTATYMIPQISVPSKRLDCNIEINLASIKITTEYNDTNISYLVANQVPTGTYNLPITTSCGSDLTCKKIGTKLRCE